VIRPRDMREPRKGVRATELRVTIRAEIPAALPQQLAEIRDLVKLGHLTSQLDRYNAAGAPYGWTDAGVRRWLEEQG
jgi:hypothetical protein